MTEKTTGDVIQPQNMKKVDSASRKKSKLELDHMDTYENWLKFKWFTPKPL